MPQALLHHLRVLPEAEDFVFAIFDYCGGLAEFPMIGLAKDDLRPGLRTIGFRRRVVVAFAVNETPLRFTASTTAVRTTRP